MIARDEDVGGSEIAVQDPKTVEVSHAGCGIGEEAFGEIAVPGKLGEVGDEVSSITERSNESWRR